MRLLAGLICAGALAAAIYNPVTGWVAAPGGGSPSPTPTYRWIFSEGSGTTVADEIASNTLNFCTSSFAPSWTGGGGVTIGDNDCLSLSVDLDPNWATQDVAICWAGAHNGSAGRHGYLGDWDNSTAPDGSWFFASNGTRIAEVLMRGTGGDYEVNSPSSTLTSGTYYHVCLVKPAGTNTGDLAIYVDGSGITENIVESTLTAFPPSNTDYLGDPGATLDGNLETQALTVWVGTVPTALQIADWCAEDENLLDARSKATPWGCN